MFLPSSLTNLSEKERKRGENSKNDGPISRQTSKTFFLSHRLSLQSTERRREENEVQRMYTWTEVEDGPWFAFFLLVSHLFLPCKRVLNKYSTYAPVDSHWSGRNGLDLLWNCTVNKHERLDWGLLWSQEQQTSKSAKNGDTVWGTERNSKMYRLLS